ncbi:auxin-responsive protein SAUR36-like [Ananas comosus]|uniref:Auxin-responsive protein SAUR36-like n=1 Tax=Ananas comosus TaxID=4615 RepID=A0A6P5HMG0_ANACO|nr:auxin-responsive protein SAUR36-like [Ananas comosus]
MAKKWQRMAASGMRRIAMARRDAGLGSEACSTSVAEKGHCVMYSMDRKRFMVLLAYLSSRIFAELFKMSEEEFGLMCDAPITLPCYAVFMEYAMSLLRRRVSEEVERALLSSILIPCHFSCSLPSVELTQHVAVCSC